MIEILEPRIAPAGIIDLKLVNGLLTAKTLAAGDGEEVLVISQLTDGELRVDPTPGTRLQFAGATLADGELLTFQGVAALSVSLGAGNDTLTIVNARLTKSLFVDLGTGANDLTLASPYIGGSFTVIGGPSADTITVSGSSAFTVGQKATFTLGDGDNEFSSTVPVFSVGRDFRLTSGTDADTITWAGEKANFGAKFTVLTGDGADSVQVIPSKDVFIGRDAVMTSLNIDPAAVVKQRIAPADSLNIGGNVKFTAKSGDVLQELLADAGSLSVAGSVAFASGGGKASQRIDSAGYLAIAGNLGISTKAQATASTVVTTGLNPEGSYVGGSVTLFGHKTVQFYASAFIGGSMKIVAAAGQAASVMVGFDFSNGVRIGGGFTIATSETASATSNVSVLECSVVGAFKLTGGAGVTNAILNDSVFFGSVFADLGGNDDHFRVEDLLTAGVSAFHGQVVLRGGDGNDTFQISGSAGSDVVKFFNKVLLDGGAGMDTVKQGTGATIVVPIVMANIP